VTRAELIAAAFKWACLAELDVPKPGNVHVFADGHRMTADQFVSSAEAAAGPLAKPSARVGPRILGAVEATFTAVGTNTNLGIILLCAPLAAAGEAPDLELRAALCRVLRGLDRDDAACAFRAIVRASPAGLGRSPRHDVFEPPLISLLQAMIEAAERDRIARQYATNFADIFDLGLPLLESALEGRDPKWAIVATYLGFLSAFPDSHIVRKLGDNTAAGVRHKASQFQASLRAATHPSAILPDLLAWDRELKSQGVNPGTSADLTVGTLFVHRLQTILPFGRNND